MITMVKRRIKLFSQGTTIRVDEWVYNTCQELMDLFTNMSGASNYQQPFMTLSATVLTLTSYSIKSEDGLLSKDDKYLTGLLSESNKKPASLTITLEYDESFLSLVDSLLSKYKSLGIKLSFSETIRIALLNFTQIYNTEPVIPLLHFFVLMSSSDPMISNMDADERLIAITSFKYPALAPPLKASIKRYYSNLPDLFLNNIDKGLNGSTSLLREKINIWLPAVTNFKESLNERMVSVAEASTIDMAFIGYLVYMSVSKKIVEKSTKDALQVGSVPNDLYSAYSIFPLSYLPFSIFSVLPFYHTDFKDELSDVIAKIIRPVMQKIMNAYFSSI